MRAEAKLHQGFRFRKARGREPMIGLVASHRLARLIVPAATRLCIQVACLDQGLLNFLNALRLRAQACPPAPIRGG